MLDDQSKKTIVDQLQLLKRPDLKDIIGLIGMDADLSLRPNLLAFLQRFVKHKDLDLNVFPKEAARRFPCTILQDDAPGGV